jgi:hypothetical protein
MAKKRQPRSNRERLRELIEEATVDCYGEDEQHTGLLTMIEDEVVCPFRAKVVGEDVEVTGFEWPKDGFGLYAVCQRKGKKHRVDINSLEWVKPKPKGFQWIEAYLAWRQGIDDGDKDEEE